MIHSDSDSAMHIIKSGDGLLYLPNPSHREGAHHAIGVYLGFTLKRCDVYPEFRESVYVGG